MLCNRIYFEVFQEDDRTRCRNTIIRRGALGDGLGVKWKDEIDMTLYLDYLTKNIRRHCENVQATFADKNIRHR